MGKLKTFTKTGAENSKGEVINPPKNNDISRVAAYLGLNENNEIVTVSESIYITYNSPYYHLYTESGKINCPFDIKYYCVKKGILVGLLDSAGYWHVVAIDSATATVKTIYENLANIESADYNHVVCRQTNDNQFVYSLKEKELIIGPTYCNSITLHAEGIHVKRKNIEEIYNYSGYTILTDNWDLSIVKGITINSHELILAKDRNNFYGLYSFTGKCILPCHYKKISINRHYCNRNEYITLDTSSQKKHTLFFLDAQLTVHETYTNYLSIDFFDCGRVAVIESPDKSVLCNMNLSSNNPTCVELLSADKIASLYDFSCNHFYVRKKTKYGVCDLQGKIIVPIKYQRVTTNEWNDKVYAYNKLGLCRTFNI